MSDVTVSNPASSTAFKAAGWPTLKVRIRENWTDEWSYDHRLILLRFENTLQPVMPTAFFAMDVGEVKANFESVFATIGPPDYRDWYVQIIQVTPPTGAATDEDDETQGSDIVLWAGVFVDQQITYHGANAAGAPLASTANLQAFGMEHLLDVKTMHESYIEQDSIVNLMEGVPPMNMRTSRGGSLYGNRATAAESGTLYNYSGDGAIWTHRDYAEYCTTKFKPTGLTFVLAGATDVLDQFKSYAQFEGMTPRQVLNILIDRRRGVAWNCVMFDGSDTINVQVSTLFPEPITVGATTLTPIPQIRSIDATDPFIEGFELRRITGAKFETIRVFGEPLRICCTLSYPDNTLVKGWTNAEETAYETAITNPTDQDGQPKWDRVWTEHILSPSAQGYPVAGNGAGGGNVTVSITVTNDGQPDTANQSNFWRSFRGFLPILPLEAGKDYTTDPATDNTGGLKGTEFFKPFVIIKDTITGGSAEYMMVGQSGRELEMSRTPGLRARVSMLDHRLGIRVETFPRHSMGLNNFATPNNTLKADIQYDYTQLIATICLELDKRLEVKISNQGEVAGQNREKIIVIPGQHLWMMAPNTVVGINTTTPTTLWRSPAAWMTLRTDVAKLQAIAAAASAWHSKERSTLHLSTTNLADRFAFPGSYIADLTIGTHVEQINTTVSTETWDIVNGKITIQTQYNELDFGSFTDSIEAEGIPGTEVLSQKIQHFTNSLRSATEAI